MWVYKIKCDEPWVETFHIKAQGLDEMLEKLERVAINAFDLDENDDSQEYDIKSIERLYKLDA